MWHVNEATEYCRTDSTPGVYTSSGDPFRIVCKQHDRKDYI